MPVDEPDGFGGRLRRYVAGPVLWGSLEALGTAAPRGGRHDRPSLYRASLRYRPGVNPAMRLADGTRRFAIRAADDPDGRRRDLDGTPDFRFSVESGDEAFGVRLRAADAQ